jgi:hypothetical protein
MKNLLKQFIVLLFFFNGTQLSYSKSKVIFIKQQDKIYTKNKIKLKADAFVLCFNMPDVNSVIINTSKASENYKYIKKKKNNYQNIPSLNHFFPFAVNNDKELLVGKNESVLIKKENSKTFFHQEKNNIYCREVNYFFDPSNDDSFKPIANMILYFSVLIIDDNNEVYRKIFKVKFIE